MADYTQVDHVFRAHQHFVNDTTYSDQGASEDVRGFLSGTIYIDHAPIEDATINNPGIEYRVQVNHDPAEGGEFWRTIATFVASTDISTMETLDGVGAASGQAVVPTVATGDFTRGDWIYLLDDDGAAGSEWGQVSDIDAGVNITVVDDLTNAFVATDDDVMIAGVVRWVMNVDLAGVAFIRVLMLNSDSTGHDWASAAYGKFASAIA